MAGRIFFCPQCGAYLPESVENCPCGFVIPAVGAEKSVEHALDEPADASFPASAPAITASTPLPASPSPPASTDLSIETSRSASTAPAAKKTPALVAAALLALVVIIVGAVLYKQKEAPLPASSASDQPRPRTAPASEPTEASGPAGEQLQFRQIPAGTFTMGCTHRDSECDPDESPPHPVTLSKPFMMAQTETTNAQYGRCVAGGACSPPIPSTDYNEAGKGGHPVVNVTWGDAASFCRWAGARLPTEAEWEYAARGGRTEWRYPWGVSISHDNANYKETGGRDQWSSTSPVASFEPTGFGLYDMSGNAWEWVADWYGEYPQSHVRDPSGPSSGYRRVLRGGSWSGVPRWLRVSFRVRGAPGYRFGSDGFRCARNVDGQSEASAAERQFQDGNASEERFLGQWSEDATKVSEVFTISKVGEKYHIESSAMWDGAKTQWDAHLDNGELVGRPADDGTERPTTVRVVGDSLQIVNLYGNNKTLLKVE